MTGKAGWRLPHPGLRLQSVTGLATAHSEGDPMVALGALSRSGSSESLHQTMDSVSVCKPVTKYAAE